MRDERTSVSRQRIDTVNVQLGKRSYPIVIGAGLLGEIGQRLSGVIRSRKAAVVSNPTVEALYLDPVMTSLRRAGFEAVSIEIPDGEEHKNLNSLTLIYDRLAAVRMERMSPILALGGGVVGDVAGFAAATFLRGLPLVQLPTTLVAQVDSSVGGKTAINHPAGKNLIGAFYQPQFVLIDVETLKTLPRRQFVAGLAEVIKYGAILDAELFALIERKLDQLLLLDADLLQEVIRRCCALKAMVVAQDERESDYRSVLNFGHTVGHAIETVSGYGHYLHGEAVAMGMAFAAQLSLIRGHCKQQTMERVVELLKRSGLPVDLPVNLGASAMAHAIIGDKKVASGRVKFVCIEELGRTRFEYLSVDEICGCWRTEGRKAI